MLIKFNDTVLPVYPKSFKVTTLDLDDGETTVRASDGTLNRDRIAVKRQIEVEWPALLWKDISQLLQLMSGVFFSVYYPDPMTGQYETKTFYAGNRPCPVAFERNGELLWEGLSVTLIEK